MAELAEQTRQASSKSAKLLNTPVLLLYLEAENWVRKEENTNRARVLSSRKSEKDFTVGARTNFAESRLVEGKGDGADMPKICCKFEYYVGLSNLIHISNRDVLSKPNIKSP